MPTVLDALSQVKASFLPDAPDDTTPVGTGETSKVTDSSDVASAVTASLTLCVEGFFFGTDIWLPDLCSVGNAMSSPVGLVLKFPWKQNGGGNKTFYQKGKSKLLSTLKN